MIFEKAPTASNEVNFWAEGFARRVYFYKKKKKEGSIGGLSAEPIVGDLTGNQQRYDVKTKRLAFWID